ncbi:MAG: cysteine desulfurase [Phycisphaerales bacterium]|nr:cysteine desulfurase [Phycisphaerales bacterium]
MIYLDSNATTQPHPRVVEAMTGCLTDGWANPSSTHRPGGAARRSVDNARGAVASLIGCRPRDLVFASGGTESANLAIRGSLAAQPGKRHLATSRLEHAVMRDTPAELAASGVHTHWLEHTADGLVDLDRLESLLEAEADNLALVSVMWVNNETGIEQPINTIGAMCREHGVRFHTDAVQAVGRIPVDVASLNVDLLGFSGHKFHGPKGVGGLYVAPGVSLPAQQTGGGQEGGRRGGTENVPGLVGIGVAAEEAAAWLGGAPSETGPSFVEASKLQSRFESTLAQRVPSMVINGGDAPRAWTTSNVGFPGLETEGLLMVLSERGVCASGGSACASGSLEPSPILLAMGVPDAVAHGSLRFSFSRFTEVDELDAGLEVLVEVVEQLGRTVASSA